MKKKDTKCDGHSENATVAEEREGEGINSLHSQLSRQTLPTRGEFEAVE